MCVPPADEHLAAGEHRHAELGTPAALRENLPGAPGAAGLARLAQRAQTGPAHLDFQPQRHPDGARREGAPLHGLRTAAGPPGTGPPVLPSAGPSSVPAHASVVRGRGQARVTSAWFSG